MNTHIPNGSIVNFFGSGGHQGGPRLEVVKPGPTSRPVNLASPMTREAAYRQLEQARLDLSTDPATIYRARAAAGAALRADTASKAPKPAQDAIVDAASIYAVRRLNDGL